MSGIFDLQSADDLCGKLRHDFERVQANARDSYAAYDFVVTAWHLLEWWRPGNENAAARRTTADENPILRVCEHLAVGAKHFDPHNPNLRSVERSTRDSAWALGAWGSNTWAAGVWKDDLIVHLDGVAKDKYGETITISELAVAALEFWTNVGPCRSQ